MSRDTCLCTRVYTHVHTHVSHTAFEDPIRPLQRLRQDHLVCQMVAVVDRLLKDAGLDLKLLQYVYSRCKAGVYSTCIAAGVKRVYTVRVNMWTQDVHCVSYLFLSYTLLSSACLFSFLGRCPTIKIPSPLDRLPAGPHRICTRQYATKRSPQSIQRIYPTVLR